MITWSRFQEIIKVLRDRKILQGQTTLYITPKLLHIKLWSEWFDHYGVGFNINAFEARLTPTLVQWFHEMYRYARESRDAMAIVRKLLDETGPFGDPDFFRHRRGAEFFLHLTDAAPDAALRRLEETVGTWNVDELRRFTEGRRQVVWALEKIAVWRDLFDGAARLLLRLAEAENETFANNATGVFADLFSPGYGGVAATEASPEERFPVLSDALFAESKEQRTVALRAADHALETDHFSRMLGAEFQGLRRPPQLWVPKTWGELFDAYRRVWELLAERLDELPDDERAEAIRILLRHAGGIGRMANLTPIVTATLSALLDRAGVDRRAIIEVVENVYRHRARKLIPEARQHWDTLREALRPKDLHARLERYVGMERWADAIDDHGRRTNRLAQIVAELARDAHADPDALRRELSWLVTEEAKNGFQFGYALGQIDLGSSHLPDILAAQRRGGSTASVFFLGGYLRALSERSQSACEEVLDQLATDPALMRFLPELSWRSGLTDRGGLRIITLARSGAFDPGLFRMFSFGGVIRNLSEGVFHQWIEFLLERNTPSLAGTAVDLYYFYYIMADPPLPLPRDPTLALVTAEPFFTPRSTADPDDLKEHSWKGVAEALVTQHPAVAADVGAKLVAYFGEKGSVIAGFYPSAADVLNAIVRDHPHEMWQEIVRYIGPPIDARAYRLTHWLRGGVISDVPAELVWAWIDADVERRAPYAATFVPATFPGEPNTASARELLVRYGSRADVRGSLIANFLTEFWAGRASAHYASKLHEVSALKAKERDLIVSQWLREYEESIRQQVDESKIREERDDL